MDELRDRRRRRVAEAGAWIVAAALGVAVVARVAATARGALLFTDGDSMLPLLVMRSLDVGQPQDWAMSSVLFLPELAVFRGLWILGLGADATIVLAGVVNVVALYGALRVAAGARARTAAPVAAALAALCAFAVLAGLDHTASRDSLELASLLTTTTYYCATVVAVVATLGLLRRLADGSPHPRALLVVVAAVALVSVLSNPLFLLWATAPLVVLLVALHLLGRRPPGAVLLVAAAALAGGSVLGYLCRIPLAPFIANDGLGYIDPGRLGASLAYYTGLVAGLCGSPLGAMSFALSLVLFAGAVAATVVLARRGARNGALLIAAAGWVLPVVVVVAAIVLGTNAARYLQPAVYAPVTAVVVVPDLLRMPRRRTAARFVALAAGVVVVAGAAGAGVPRLVAAAHRDDADLACVTGWVDRSGRTGAGQYWTVRLPKAHVADPRALVQVDNALRPYDWLVNRRDGDAGSVSFLVIDAQSPAFVLPAGVTTADATTVACGRYTIADFGDRSLPLGAPRS